MKCFPSVRYTNSLSTKRVENNIPRGKMNKKLLFAVLIVAGIKKNNPSNQRTQSGKYNYVLLLALNTSGQLGTCVNTY